jgi:hypothetical protein
MARRMSSVARRPATMTTRIAIVARHVVEVGKRLPTTRKRLATMDGRLVTTDGRVATMAERGARIERCFATEANQLAWDALPPTSVIGRFTLSSGRPRTTARRRRTTEL